MGFSSSYLVPWCGVVLGVNPFPELREGAVLRAQVDHLLLSLGLLLDPGAVSTKQLGSCSQADSNCQIRILRSLVLVESCQGHSKNETWKTVNRSTTWKLPGGKACQQFQESQFRLSYGVHKRPLEGVSRWTLTGIKYPSPIRGL